MLVGVLPLLSALATEPRAAMQSAGLLGWLGAGLLSASLLLMVREPAFAAWFGGLERMYRWHHALGTLGYVALLAHVLALAAALLPESPAAAWRAVAPWTQDWTGIAGWLALVGLMAGLAGTFAMRLPYTFWRRLHLSLAAAVVLGLAHVVAVSGFSASAGLAVTPALVAIAWRLLRADRGMSARPYEVVTVSRPARDIVEVTLRPLGAPLSIAPGQFVMGAFFEGPRYRGCGEYHPFTVSGIGQGGLLTVTIKALGDCTRDIQALERGVAARIQGPYGAFLTGRPPVPELWIAGGIGITPFMAVLRSHAITRPTTLIYAFQDARDTAYLEEIEFLAKAQPLLQYHPLAIQDDIRPIDALLETIPDLGTRQAYLCGPPPMVAAVMSRLRERGLQSDRIHTERYDLR